MTTSAIHSLAASAVLQATPHANRFGSGGTKLKPLAAQQRCATYRPFHRERAKEC